MRAILVAAAFAVAGTSSAADPAAANQDCLQCHEHNKTDMDAKHLNRPGYVYESNACYTCHRDS